MDSVKKYWKSLEPRERLVLAWGAAIVACILVYTQLWQPWREALNFMDESVHQMRLDSVWMEQQAAMLKNGGGIQRSTTAPSSDQSLLSIVQSTARRARLDKAIQQMVPDQANESVRVSLEAANFNQWVLWIDDLYRNHGVNISLLNAEKEDEKPNLADIRVTFFR